MWKNIGYDQCLSFINCQVRPGKAGGRRVSVGRPTVTISRLTGAGARTVASKLADYLQLRAPGECLWTVFDRNLMERVLEDHHLPKRLADFLPEAHQSMIRDALEELLGLHPSHWTVVQQTAETILRLAQMGGVILVGRGASIITRKLDNVFHVRLVGALETRLARVRAVHDLDHDTALAFIQKEDSGRRRYLKDHYAHDIDNPLLYHLVINTDRIGCEEAARLIGDEVVRRFPPERHRAPDNVGSG
ncbi:MAG: cytidylate kinase family protein [Verrucomicrobia bacterium]|nr:cytidylate kinase family protein [Verrucomicrobiota bacterium]